MKLFQMHVKQNNKTNLTSQMKMMCMIMCVQFSKTYQFVTVKFFYFPCKYLKLAKFQFHNFWKMQFNVYEVGKREWGLT